MVYLLTMIGILVVLTGLLVIAVRQRIEQVSLIAWARNEYDFPDVAGLVGNLNQERVGRPRWGLLIACFIVFIAMPVVCLLMGWFWVCGILIAIPLIIMVILATGLGGYLGIGGFAAPEWYTSELQLLGEFCVPRRVYSGDSCSITLSLEHGEYGSTADERHNMLVRFHRGLAEEGMLEAELLCAGADVAGSLIQSHRVYGETIGYRWNLFFKRSGIHDLDVVLRIRDPAQVINLGTITREVRVVRVDGLTSRQCWILTGIFGGVTGLLTIAASLKALLDSRG